MITKSILLLMAIHFMADQVLQIKGAQLHKAKHYEMLIVHVLCYGITIMAFAGFVAYQMQNLHFMWKFTLSVMITHYLIELAFGKLADMMYESDRRRMAVMFFAAEFTLSMVSLVLLFNYFLWN